MFHWYVFWPFILNRIIWTYSVIFIHKLIFIFIHKLHIVKSIFANINTGINGHEAYTILSQVIGVVCSTAFPLRGLVCNYI